MHETSRPRGGSAASAMTTGPGRDPPAARAADSAETARRLIQDRDRIGNQINDVVVRRLFSAGLALQSALGLLDGHRAGENIQDARWRPGHWPAVPHQRPVRSTAVVADIRDCEQCGTRFVPRREHARFCSAGCRAAWNHEHMGDLKAGEKRADVVHHHHE
jgi:hypothetical protein